MERVPVHKAIWVKLIKSKKRRLIYKGKDLWYLTILWWMSMMTENSIHIVWYTLQNYDQLVEAYHLHFTWLQKHDAILYIIRFDELDSTHAIFVKWTLLHKFCKRHVLLLWRRPDVAPPLFRVTLSIHVSYHKLCDPIVKFTFSIFFSPIQQILCVISYS